MDGVVFSVPEYAGALPGSFKNLLDRTIGDDQPGSIYEKPVAWINASPRGAVNAHEQTTAAGARLRPRHDHRGRMHPGLGDHGHDQRRRLIADTAIREEIAKALTILAPFMEAARRGTSCRSLEVPLYPQRSVSRTLSGTPVPVPGRGDGAKTRSDSR